MKATDEQILMWVSHGTTVDKGFKALMDTYQTRLYSIVRPIVGNHEDTDDVLQNTYIKAYRHISRFEGRSGLYTWLYRIAYNEALTMLKRNRSRRSLSMDDEESSSAYNLTAGQNIDGDQTQQWLSDAIEDLPAKQRLVFESRYYLELPYEEISKNTGTSVGALKASYHHAVRKVETFIISKQEHYERG